jgi:predicted transposase/invertase (TIGR01784 family)
MKFVNPKNDIAFRKIFGSQEKSEILIAFLNAVLDLNGEKAIQSVRVLNPYQTPTLKSLKMTILDVKVVDKRGVTFIVEMQIEHTVAVKKRFTYYTAKAYASQIERGDEYPKLNQVIFIGILDFTLFPHNDNYLSRHQVLDTVTHRQELTDLEFNFIELPKFTKKADEMGTVLDKWIYFIKYADDLEVEPEHVKESALHQAYQSANQFGWSREDMEAYEYRGMRMQDARGALEYAALKGEAIGLQKGEAIGIQKGIQKGEAIGIQKGEAIGLQKGELIGIQKVAQTMLDDGFALAKVSRLTGLSVPELQELQTETGRESQR